MFSGIIEDIGRVEGLEYRDKALALKLKMDCYELILGESIAVNGVCLTVTDVDETGGAAFFVSQETLLRTNLGSLVLHSEVNIERSLKVSSRLSGHIVQGHVDGMAGLVSIDTVDEARLLRFSSPGDLRQYMVEKGSIALNGISLTINNVSDSPKLSQDKKTVFIEVMVIPHTWHHTTLKQIQIGECVNIEVDILAKYVENLCRTW